VAIGIRLRCRCIAAAYALRLRVLVHRQRELDRGQLGATVERRLSIECRLAALAVQLNLAHQELIARQRRLGRCWNQSGAANVRQYRPQRRGEVRSYRLSALAIPNRLHQE
jgi:hypothetical protein